MKLDDFNYDLPDKLIARYPLAKRSASRLLCLLKRNEEIIHQTFSYILDLIEENDLLVFNDTRVIPARLIGYKNTGGQVEILVERILNDEAMLAQIKKSKTLHPGSKIYLEKNYVLEVTARNNQFYQLRLVTHESVSTSENCDSILDMLETIGQIPLPPYLHRSPEEEDIHRYQTVYAKYKGSVAAPTAGFHFDEELLQQLVKKKVDIGYLTLHIGYATFSPVRIDLIHEHKMHSEYLEVDSALCSKIIAAKARGKRVIAVGTTSLRALETATQSGITLPYRGETSIFIYPGYQFRCADALITNFHLPRSTLLMLVCAFGGYHHVMQAYREAVSERYRFYSYGDAMWVDKA